MPACALKVQLIRHTAEPERIVALGARLCYSGKTLGSLIACAQAEEQDAFLRDVIGSGHASVMEHAVFTFAVEGVSRALMAQLTRHRIASFSVQSQRYVSKAKGFGYIIPPSIERLGEEAVREYEAQMETIQGWYASWRERLGGKGEQANEDARFVLPNACETRLMLTMNARELTHFFSLRCCRRAQWEIRSLADTMLRLAYQAAPALFEAAGPPCVHGPCGEGERSCGQGLEVRQHLSKLKQRG